MRVTEAFTDACAALVDTPIPQDVATEVRRRLAAAASRTLMNIDLPTIDRLVEGALADEADGAIGLPLRSERVDRPTAALTIGAAARATDSEPPVPTVRDTSAPVFGALFAAESTPTDTTSAPSAALAAAAVGLEVMSRIAAAMAPRHEADGWDTTGTVGAFGAGVAVALAIGLRGEPLRNTIAIASSMNVGHGDGRGSDLPRFHAGKAAANGLAAAFLARRGFTGSPTALEGPRGYFRVIAEYVQPEAILAGLGSDWMLLDDPESTDDHNSVSSQSSAPVLAFLESSADDDLSALFAGMKGLSR